MKTILVLFFSLLSQVLYGGELKIKGMPYPPLALQASVSGAVELMVENDGEIQVVSGANMLVMAAVSYTKEWVDEVKGRETLVIYDFILHKPSIDTIEVPIGNWVERLFLKMLCKPTYREETRCTPWSPPERKVEEPRVRVEPGFITIKVEAVAYCMYVVSCPAPRQ